MTGILRTDYAISRFLCNVVLTVLLVSDSVAAATQSVTANASFDVVLSLVKDSDISFGTLKAATGATYVIDANGTVTPSGAGRVVGGTPAHGQITITGSATQTIAIGTGSYTANGGVTPSAATCNYDSSLIANCDAGGAGLAAPGGAGKILKLGVTIVTDGNQTAGTTAAPSFVVSVVYD